MPARFRVTVISSILSVAAIFFYFYQTKNSQAVTDSPYSPDTSSFENWNSSEISSFLHNQEIVDPGTSIAKLPQVEKIKDKETLSRFNGNFLGILTIANPPDVESNFLQNGKYTVRLSLNGHCDESTYMGKFLFTIENFEGREVSSTSSEGYLNRIKIRRSEQSPSLVWSDNAHREPSYFQVFISDSRDSMIGNYYSHVGTKLRKVGTLHGYNAL